MRKVLRFLLERIRPKMTAIEQSKDLNTVKNEELVGSQQTYELIVSQSKKNKSIALNIVREEKYDSTYTKTINDEEIGYFVKKNSKNVSK